MTFFFTNDDGIDAPGIATLRSLFPSEESLLIAPKSQSSSCGHKITNKEPIAIEERGPQTYAIAGTPADCSKIALNLVTDRISWAFAGINAGGNLGTDVYNSGTVAAIRELAFQDIPGIAISQLMKGPAPINWEITKHQAARVLQELLCIPMPPYSFWNVNLPHLEPGDPDPPIRFCQLSTSPLPVQFRIEDGFCHYEGNYLDRHVTPGSDVEACFSGAIAVTLLKI